MSNILDHKEKLEKMDPGSMRTLLETFPGQLETAIRNGREMKLSIPRKPGAVVITGLGGSAISGDLVRSVAGNGLKIPLFVNRDYQLPAFIDSSSLVLACSYSGNTEETISAYGQARQAGAAIICMTSGGQLETMAIGDQVPVLKLPGGLQPRAALGHALMTLLTALEAIDIIPDMSVPMQETVELVKNLCEQYKIETPLASNRAKRIADTMHGKIAVIYGSSVLLEAAAYRWRTQIAENAKNLAFHHALPEMNHNELVGWQFPEELLRNVGVILLRDKGDHPQVQHRFELTREIIETKAGVAHDVWSEGDSLLARVLSVICLGDFVSLYLAFLNSVDPTPVQVIEDLKKRLSSGR
jgi:glucose/mannose-6-phosphate isomerase